MQQITFERVEGTNPLRPTVRSAETHGRMFGYNGAGSWDAAIMRLTLLQNF